MWRRFTHASAVVDFFRWTGARVFDNLRRDSENKLGTAAEAESFKFSSSQLQEKLQLPRQQTYSHESYL